MVQHHRLLVVFFALLNLTLGVARGEDPLRKRVDALIAAKAGPHQASTLADDAEFLRRVYLDLVGRIPSVQEARSFLADGPPDKRSTLVDCLLASDDYPTRMQELFHVMLMERLGDHDAWKKYLHDSFAANKPWNDMARDMLRADPQNETARGAAFFYAKRLDHYGQNPIDFPGLTRDVGRLFLGVDLRCAQCHDHLFIDDYKQDDFQGLFAFFQNTFLQDLAAPAVGEKPTVQKVSFMSVFVKVEKQTGPRLPGGTEIAVPAVHKGEEYAQPPDAKTRFPGMLKFSPLASLAEQLPRAENRQFTRNIVNRLWFAMMGRGLVHPLDLSHTANPPSHPELLDLLAQEFAAHNFDVKWFLRELVLSQTYQRSSMLAGEGPPPPPELFLTAIEKRLSAEQLTRGMSQALGERERLETADGGKPYAELQAKFIKAFANAPREPEDAFSPSLASALFVLHDAAVLEMLASRPGNLVDRLDTMADTDQIAEELYLALLTRFPTDEERAEVADYLAGHPDRRSATLGQLAWALLASTEFCVNH
ncbi:MAG TPA: DUF1553 domain-containing protein [Pirellulales bacterium]|nr:DUF1553 domain-containing protein [Pirellulales bacterium]